MRRGNFGIVLGRGLGLAVFLAGIGVMIFVFITAYYMFTSSNLVGTNAQAIAGVVGALAGILVKILLLFVMLMIGSITASKGIEMYSAMQKNSGNAGAPQNTEE